MKSAKTSLDAALARYVADFSIPEPGDATRFRGAVTDLMAGDARLRRAEVDAAVIAVEEGLLRDPGGLGPDAVRTLVERGVDSELAAATVIRWAAAVGRTSTVTVPSRSPASPDASRDFSADATALPPRTAAGAQPSAPSAKAQRNVVLAVVAALAVAVAVAFALSRSGSDDMATGPSTVTAPETTVPTSIVTTTTTTPPTTTTASPEVPLPAPIATSDSYRWIPTQGGGWYEADLPVLDNDSGTWTDIEWSALDNNHVILRWDTTSFKVQPRYNGYFTDGFSYRLLNGASSSEWVRVELVVDCNDAYECS